MLDFTIKLKAGNSVRIIDEETAMEFGKKFLEDKVYVTDVITDDFGEPLPYSTIYAIDVEASGDTEGEEGHLFDGIFGDSN